MRAIEEANRALHNIGMRNTVSLADGAHVAWQRRPIGGIGGGGAYSRQFFTRDDSLQERTVPTTPVSHMPALRIDGDEREWTVARLSEAYTNSALTMGEFELRMEAVYRATNHSDLARLTADLPTTGNSAAQAASALVGGARQRIASTFSSVEGIHIAVMPTLFEIRAFFGSVELDFRHTVFQPGVTEISIGCTLGNVELVLPAHVAVERHGDFTFSTYSIRNKGFTAANDFLPPDAPVVRFTGRAFMSNIEIKRVKP